MFCCRFLLNVKDSCNKQAKQAIDQALRSRPISFIDEETLHQSTVLRHVHLVSLQHTVLYLMHVLLQ